jgi:hypothetical protein
MIFAGCKQQHGFAEMPIKFHMFTECGLLIPCTIYMFFLRIVVVVVMVVKPGCYQCMSVAKSENPFASSEFRGCNALPLLSWHSIL